MEQINQSDERHRRQGFWKGECYEATYKDDTLHGPVTYFNHNKTVFYTGKFNMDVAVGLWIHYHTDGTYRNTILYAR